MEVQGIARTREARHQLKVRVSFIGESSKNSLLLEKLDENCIAVENNPHLLINFKSQKIYLHLTSKLSLALNSTNLNSSLKLAQKYILNLTEQHAIGEAQEKILNQNQKKIKKWQSSIKKNTDHTSKLFSLLDTNTLFAQIKKIQNIPATILSIPRFKSFQSCQILVHEKGKQEVTNYIYDNHNPIKISSLSVSNFNSIFNQIKKSKNKLFSQALILRDCPGVLGTFLAKEYDLPSYRIVLIVSRNDFLPPSPEEQRYFTSFSSQLYSIYAKVLWQEKYAEKIKRIQNALQKSPFPIAIKNEHGLTVFKNKLVDDDQPANILPLPSGHTIHLQTSNSKNQYADAYHLQRITLLGELLNTLRHELGNPLFGIKLTAELLEDSSSDSEAKEIFCEISKSCLRCQKIIEDFSYLYRDENSFSEIDLEKLINETMILAKSATQSIKKTVELDHTANNLFLTSNPTWISQIIFNLVINSAQALNEAETPSPKIKIQVSTNKQEICISISDNGPGITQQIETQIFEPFFTTKPKGTGLGLSICTNLTKKLGGEITFKNNKKMSGVTFTLKLSRDK